MTYPEDLAKAWQEAKAPRAKDAPKSISTFAGCGGSSLGYKMAGFDVRLAVEFDPHAIATYRLNFPTTAMHAGDIAQLSVERAKELAGVEEGELDVFDGSPPCQGFSMSGSRMISDDRNQLFREYVRLLSGLRPKVFVMENVMGMVLGRMKPTFVAILRELKQCGYRVSCRALNAQFLGVPQARPRVIFVGVREDLGVEPSHPKPYSDAIRSAEACDDFDPHGPLALRIPCAPINGPLTRELAMKIKPGNLGNTVKFEKHDPRHKGIPSGGRAYWDWWKLHPDKPARTITKSTRGDTGIFVPDGSRGPSVGELMRLASFPDEFQFALTGDDRKDWKNALARIGNSVPPLMMRAIAKHIREEILRR